MKKLTLWLAILNVLAMAGMFSFLYLEHDSSYKGWIGLYDRIGFNCFSWWVILTIAMLVVIIYNYINDNRYEKKVIAAQKNLEQVAKDIDSFTEFISKQFTLDAAFWYFKNYATKADAFYNCRMIATNQNKQSFSTFTLWQIGPQIMIGLPYGTREKKANVNIEVPPRITLGQFKSFMQCYGFELEWTEAIKDKFGLNTNLKEVAKL